jgi:hypothetical protein
VEQPNHTPSPGRIETPYSTWETNELVRARESLSDLCAADSKAREGEIGNLVVWATLELAERLSAFVRLAVGLGLVRALPPGPPPRPRKGVIRLG